MKANVGRLLNKLKQRIFEWIAYDPTPFVYQPIRVRKAVPPRSNPRR